MRQRRRGPVPGDCLRCDSATAMACLHTPAASCAGHSQVDSKFVSSVTLTAYEALASEALPTVAVQVLIAASNVEPLIRSFSSISA